MSSSSRKLRKTENEELISQQRKMLIKHFQNFVKYWCRPIFEFWPHKLRGKKNQNITLVPLVLVFFFSLTLFLLSRFLNVPVLIHIFQYESIFLFSGTRSANSVLPLWQRWQRPGVKDENNVTEELLSVNSAAQKGNDVGTMCAGSCVTHSSSQVVVDVSPMVPRSRERAAAWNFGLFYINTNITLLWRWIITLKRFNQSLCRWIWGNATCQPSCQLVFILSDVSATGLHSSILAFK